MLLITAAAHRHSEAGCVQEEQTEKKNVELGGASVRGRGFNRGRGFVGRGFRGRGFKRSFRRRRATQNADNTFTITHSL